MRGFVLALLSPFAFFAVAVPAGATVPVNVSPPGIASNPPGSAYVGAGLGLVGGTWTATPAPGTSISIQWLRCDSGGEACAPVPGATAGIYRLVPADVGHTIRVQETASNGADVSAPAVSAPSVVVRELPVGVSYTSLPVITGRPLIGQTLRVSDGTWTGTPPITFTYQWQRCKGVPNPGGGSFTLVCTDIPGATQSTYTVSGADAGALLLALVTGRNSVSAFQLHAGGYTLPVPAPPRTIGDALEAVLDLGLGESRTVSVSELLSAGGYRTTFSAVRPGRLAIRWTTLRKHKPVLVGSAHATFLKRGTYPVTIKLTRRGRTLLQRRHLRMTLLASFKGRGRTATRYNLKQAVVKRPDGRFGYVPVAPQF